MTKTQFYSAILLLVGESVALGSACAESNMEAYELQERCSKRVEEIYKNEYGGGGVRKEKDFTYIHSYRNHYNSKLNKCFFLEITTGYSNQSNNKESYNIVMETLFDINENKEYGIYFKRNDAYKPTTCSLEDNICHSREEWENLLKQYMEE